MTDKAANFEGSIHIGAGVQFKGDVIVPGCAAVDGKFEGTLKAKSLIVGQSGHVSGQISVETAEVRGTVCDRLTVQSNLMVRATGVISGAVSYARIMVEDGGELAGTIDRIAKANVKPALVAEPQPESEVMIVERQSAAQ